MSMPLLRYRGSYEHIGRVTMSDFLPVAWQTYILTYGGALPGGPITWWHVAEDCSLTHLDSASPLTIGQGVTILEPMHWAWQEGLFHGLMAYQPLPNKVTIARLDPSNASGSIEEEFEIGGGAGSGITFTEVTWTNWEGSWDHPVWRDPGILYLFRNKETGDAELHLIQFINFSPKHAWGYKVYGLPKGGCVRWINFFDPPVPRWLAYDGSAVHFFEPGTSWGQDHVTVVENYTACECSLGPEVFVISMKGEEVHLPKNYFPEMPKGDYRRSTVLSYDPEDGRVLMTNIYLPPSSLTWALNAETVDKETTHWPKHSQMRLSPTGTIIRYSWDTRYFDFGSIVQSS